MAGQFIGEANALNDLASIEYMLGDPGQALGVFERALAIHRQSGSTSETILPMINIALCLNALERFAVGLGPAQPVFGPVNNRFVHECKGQPRGRSTANGTMTSSSEIPPCW
jgi:hypothetical protein